MDTHVLLDTLLYTALGAVVFALVFVAVVKLAPFSVRKEIEEDQNIALGLVIASLNIGFAIIIAAVIGGGT
jgi:putative membrane protein